jgi:hypothetical protein
MGCALGSYYTWAGPYSYTWAGPYSYTWIGLLGTLILCPVDAGGVRILLAHQVGELVLHQSQPKTITPSFNLKGLPHETRSIYAYVFYSN